VKTHALSKRFLPAHVDKGWVDRIYLTMCGMRPGPSWVIADDPTCKTCQRGTSKRTGQVDGWLGWDVVQAELPLGPLGTGWEPFAPAGGGLWWWRRRASIWHLRHKRGLDFHLPYGDRDD
jgi:hypothetical protein